MQVKIDADLCTGCALCTDDLPEVFKLVDDIAEVISPNVTADREDAVKNAADDCPAEAIIIE